MKPRFYENICWRTFLIDAVSGSLSLGGIYFLVEFIEAVTK